VEDSPSGDLAIYSRLSPPRTLGVCCISPLGSGGLGSGTLPYLGRRAVGRFGNSFTQRQMLIEAVSLGVPWTAQRHRTSIGYVQVHYELGGLFNADRKETAA
jgi:hypothetical protein